MQRLLSFEQAPPLSIPLRFFLTAPLFATAAGMLLLWHGPEALASRWSPVTLALTHLLTLGFFAMSMIGALLQILPVVAGATVPKIRLTASVVHLFLALGTAALCIAFWRMTPFLFTLAIILLGVAFVILLATCLLAVLTTDSKSAMLTGIRLALAALAVTTGLGIALAGAFAWSINLPFVLLTHLHATWGLIGWIGLLIIAAAFQVVPMFQVTPLYPATMSRWLAGSLFALLAIWSVAFALLRHMAGWIVTLPAMLIAASLAAFSLSTLYLLSKRKRPAADPATWFWRVGLVSLLLGSIGWIAGELVPGIADQASWPLFLGVLFIHGFAYSVVNGMLYKIVPFLLWYHLQTTLKKGQGKAPNVKHIVTDHAANGQFVAHVVALILMLAATWWPQQFAYFSGAGFALSSMWLWINVMQGVLRCRRIGTYSKSYAS